MQVTQRMWNAMRILKSFSIVEVQHNNGSNEALKFDTVRKYLAILERGGYLLDIGKGRFKLVRNTGRLAPSMLIKKTNEGHFIKDNNLKELVPIKKAQRKLKRTEFVNKRLDEIIECFKEHTEFKVTDVMEKLGFDYDTSRRDLINLQRKGIVACIRKEFGMGGKGKEGVIWIYTVKAKYKIIYSNLIEEVKSEVIKPYIKKLESELRIVNEIIEKIKFIKVSQDYIELVNQYLPYFKNTYGIGAKLCEYSIKFDELENQK